MRGLNRDLEIFMKKDPPGEFLIEKMIQHFLLNRQMQGNLLVWSKVELSFCMPVIAPA